MAGSNTNMLGSLCFINKDGTDGRKVPLTYDTCTIGSLGTIRIKLENSHLKEIHCSIDVEKTTGMASVTNKSPMHPILINGMKVLRNRYLKPGDTLDVLGRKWRYDNINLSPDIILKLNTTTIVPSFKTPMKSRASLHPNIAKRKLSVTPDPKRITPVVPRRKRSNSFASASEFEVTQDSDPKDAVPLKTPGKRKSIRVRIGATTSFYSSDHLSTPDLRPSKVPSTQQIQHGLKVHTETHISKPGHKETPKPRLLSNASELSDVYPERDLKTPVAEKPEDLLSCNTPLDHISIVLIDSPDVDEVTPLRSKKGVVKNMSIERLMEKDDSVINLVTPEAVTPKSVMKGKNPSKTPKSALKKTKIMAELIEASSTPARKSVIVVDDDEVNANSDDDIEISRINEKEKSIFSNYTDESVYDSSFEEVNNPCNVDNDEMLNTTNNSFNIPTPSQFTKSRKSTFVEETINDNSLTKQTPSKNATIYIHEPKTPKKTPKIDPEEAKNEQTTLKTASKLRDADTPIKVNPKSALKSRQSMAFVEESLDESMAPDSTDDVGVETPTAQAGPSHSEQTPTISMLADVIDLDNFKTPDSNTPVLSKTAMKQRRSTVKMPEAEVTTPKGISPVIAAKSRRSLKHFDSNSSIESIHDSDSGDDLVADDEPVLEEEEESGLTEEHEESECSSGIPSVPRRGVKRPRTSITDDSLVAKKGRYSSLYTVSDVSLLDSSDVSSPFKAENYMNESEKELSVLQENEDKLHNVIVNSPAVNILLKKPITEPRANKKRSLPANPMGNQENVPEDVFDCSNTTIESIDTSSFIYVTGDESAKVVEDVEVEASSSKILDVSGIDILHDDEFDSLLNKKPLRTYKGRSLSPRREKITQLARKTLGVNPDVSPEVIKWVDDQNKFVNNIEIVKTPSNRKSEISAQLEGYDTPLMTSSARKSLGRKSVHLADQSLDEEDALEIDDPDDEDEVDEEEPFIHKTAEDDDDFESMESLQVSSTKSQIIDEVKDVKETSLSRLSKRSEAANKTMEDSINASSNKKSHRSANDDEINESLTSKSAKQTPLIREIKNDIQEIDETVKSSSSRKSQKLALEIEVNEDIPQIDDSIEEIKTPSNRKSRRSEKVETKDDEMNDSVDRINEIESTTRKSLRSLKSPKQIEINEDILQIKTPSNRKSRRSEIVTEKIDKIEKSIAEIESVKISSTRKSRRSEKLEMAAHEIEKNEDILQMDSVGEIKALSNRKSRKFEKLDMVSQEIEKNDDMDESVAEIKTVKSSSSRKSRKSDTLEMAAHEIETNKDILQIDSVGEIKTPINRKSHRFEKIEMVSQKIEKNDNMNESVAEIESVKSSSTRKSRKSDKLEMAAHEIETNENILQIDSVGEIKTPINRKSHRFEKLEMVSQEIEKNDMDKSVADCSTKKSRKSEKLVIATEDIDEIEKPIAEIESVKSSSPRKSRRSEKLEMATHEVEKNEDILQIDDSVGEIKTPSNRKSHRFEMVSQEIEKNDDINEYVAELGTVKSTSTKKSRKSEILEMSTYEVKDILQFDDSVREIKTPSNRKSRRFEREQELERNDDIDESVTEIKTVKSSSTKKSPKSEKVEIATHGIGDILQIDDSVREIKTPSNRKSRIFEREQELDKNDDINESVAELETVKSSSTRKSRKSVKHEMATHEFKKNEDILQIDDLVGEIITPSNRKSHRFEKLKMVSQEIEKNDDIDESVAEIETVKSSSTKKSRKSDKLEMSTLQIDDSVGEIKTPSNRKSHRFEKLYMVSQEIEKNDDNDESVAEIETVKSSSTKKSRKSDKLEMSTLQIDDSVREIKTPANRKSHRFEKLEMVSQEIEKNDDIDESVAAIETVKSSTTKKSRKSDKLEMSTLQIDDLVGEIKTPSNRKSHRFEKLDMVSQEIEKNDDIDKSVAEIVTKKSRKSEKLELSTHENDDIPQTDDSVEEIKTPSNRKLRKFESKQELERIDDVDESVAELKTVKSSSTKKSRKSENLDMTTPEIEDILQIDDSVGEIKTPSNRKSRRFEREQELNINDDIDESVPELGTVKSSSTRKSRTSEKNESLVQEVESDFKILEESCKDLEADQSEQHESTEHIVTSPTKPTVEENLDDSIQLSEVSSTKKISESDSPPKVVVVESTNVKKQRVSDLRIRIQTSSVDDIVPHDFTDYLYTAHISRKSLPALIPTTSHIKTRKSLPSLRAIKRGSLGRSVLDSSVASTSEVSSNVLCSSSTEFAIESLNLSPQILDKKACGEILTPANASNKKDRTSLRKLDIENVATPSLKITEHIGSSARRTSKKVSLAETFNTPVKPIPVVKSASSTRKLIKLEKITPAVIKSASPKKKREQLHESTPVKPIRIVKSASSKKKPMKANVDEEEKSHDDDSTDTVDTDDLETVFNSTIPTSSKKISKLNVKKAEVIEVKASPSKTKQINLVQDLVNKEDSPIENTSSKRKSVKVETPKIKTSPMIKNKSIVGPIFEDITPVLAQDRDSGKKRKYNFENSTPLIPSVSGNKYIKLEGSAHKTPVLDNKSTSIKSASPQKNTPIEAKVETKTTRRGERLRTPVDVGIVTMESDSPTKTVKSRVLRRRMTPVVIIEEIAPKLSTKNAKRVVKAKETPKKATVSNEEIGTPIKSTTASLATLATRESSARKKLKKEDEDFEYSPTKKITKGPSQTQNMSLRPIVIIERSTNASSSSIFISEETPTVELKRNAEEIGGSKKLRRGRVVFEILDTPEIETKSTRKRGGSRKKIKDASFNEENKPIVSPEKKVVKNVRVAPKRGVVNKKATKENKNTDASDEEPEQTTENIKMVASSKRGTSKKDTKDSDTSDEENEAEISPKKKVIKKNIRVASKRGGTSKKDTKDSEASSDEENEAKVSPDKKVTKKDSRVASKRGGTSKKDTKDSEASSNEENEAKVSPDKKVTKKDSRVASKRGGTSKKDTKDSEASSDEDNEAKVSPVKKVTKKYSRVASKRGGTSKKDTKDSEASSDEDNEAKVSPDKKVTKKNSRVASKRGGTSKKDTKDSEASSDEDNEAKVSPDKKVTKKNSRVASKRGGTSKKDTKDSEASSDEDNEAKVSPDKKVTKKNSRVASKRGGTSKKDTKDSEASSDEDNEAKVSPDKKVTKKNSRVASKRGGTSKKDTKDSEASSDEDNEAKVSPDKKVTKKNSRVASKRGGTSKKDTKDSEASSDEDNEAIVTPEKMVTKNVRVAPKRGAVNKKATKANKNTNASDEEPELSTENNKVVATNTRVASKRGASRKKSTKDTDASDDENVPQVSPEKKVVKNIRVVAKRGVINKKATKENKNTDASDEKGPKEESDVEESIKVEKASPKKRGKAAKVKETEKAIQSGDETPVKIAKKPTTRARKGSSKTESPKVMTSQNEDTNVSEESKDAKVTQKKAPIRSKKNAKANPEVIEDASKETGVAKTRAKRGAKVESISEGIEELPTPTKPRSRKGANAVDVEEIKIIKGDITTVVHKKATAAGKKVAFVEETVPKKETEPAKRAHRKRLQSAEDLEAAALATEVVEPPKKKSRRVYKVEAEPVVLEEPPIRKSARTRK